MAVRQPRYRKDEFARRVEEIYDNQIRAQVETAENIGKIIAIEVGNKSNYPFLTICFRS